MRRALLTIAFAVAAAPAQAVDRWHCTVGETLDEHRSAYLETLLAEPGGVRQPVNFYVSWARQRGYIAQQQMVWIAIPPEATRLWKPDSIWLWIATARTDEAGLVIFSSAGVREVVSAGRMVQSLRPHFPVTKVIADDASLVARLWAGAGWTAELRDRAAQPLGSSPILLPEAAAVQPLFARMRAALERKAADPARHCRAIPQPTQEELENSQINWGTPIRRPNLEAVEPVPVEDPPPQRIGQLGSRRKSR